MARRPIALVISGLLAGCALQSQGLPDDSTPATAATSDGGAGVGGGVTASSGDGGASASAESSAAATGVGGGAGGGTGACKPPAFAYPPTQHCYEQVLGTRLSWQEAETACIAWGGHLAGLTTQDEYEFVLAKVTELDDHNDDTWIGAHDPEPLEGMFEWATGEPWGDDGWCVGIAPWKNGNPKAGEGCIKIHDGFESVPCDATPPRGYLCERP